MLTILAITVLCQQKYVDKIVDILPFILTFLAKKFVNKYKFYSKKDTETFQLAVGGLGGI